MTLTLVNVRGQGCREVGMTYGILDDYGSSTLFAEVLYI